MQVSSFPESHLKAGGWYLDCFGGFVLADENTSFYSLLSSAPEENIVPFEEPDIVELPPPPHKAPKKNGRGKITAIQATLHLPTRSAIKTPLHKSNLQQSPASTPQLLHHLLPLLLPRHIVHQILLLLLTMALLFFPYLARGRPPSWI